MALKLELPTRDILLQNTKKDVNDSEKIVVDRLVGITADFCRIAGNHGMWVTVESWRDEIGPQSSLTLNLRSDADPELAGLRLQLQVYSNVLRGYTAENNICILVDSYQKFERSIDSHGNITGKHTRMSQVAFDKWGAKARSYRSNERSWDGNWRQFHRSIPFLIPYFKKTDKFTAKNVEVDHSKKLMQKDVRRFTDDVDYIAFNADTLMKDLFGARFGAIAQKCNGDALSWQIVLTNLPRQKIAGCPGFYSMRDAESDESLTHGLLPLPKMGSLLVNNKPVDYLTYWGGAWQVAFMMSIKKDTGKWYISYPNMRQLAIDAGVQDGNGLNFACEKADATGIIEYIQQCLTAERKAYDLRKEYMRAFINTGAINEKVCSNYLRYEANIENAGKEV